MCDPDQYGDNQDNYREIGQEKTEMVHGAKLYPKWQLNEKVCYIECARNPGDATEHKLK